MSHLGSHVSHLGSRLSHLGSQVSHLGSQVGNLGSRLSHLGSRLSHRGSQIFFYMGWKCIPLSLLSNVGGSLRFLCNYDVQYLPLNENLPKFYRDIISHWQRINNTNPKTKGDVLNQIIWNNQFIRVNKSSIFFPDFKKSRH